MYGLDLYRHARIAVLWEDAVCREPVSGRIPCLTGKIQGNIAKIGSFSQIHRDSSQEIKDLNVNSLSQLTGNFFVVTGNYQGILWRIGFLVGTG